VVKYWSAVVTTGTDAKLACKASSDIHRCIWANGESGVKFDSETDYGRRDNEVVSIGRSAGSQKDNMCFFTIDNVSEDHSGDWACTVYGKCEEEDSDYHEDDDNSFDGKKKRSVKDKKQTLRYKRQLRNRRCKSDDCDMENCKNRDMQEVKIKVVEEDEIGAMGAQEVYFANIKGKVSLTVRTNEQFTKCEIRKGRDDIVEIDGDASRDECADMPGRSAGEVCADVTRGVPSCILRIDEMAANMEGLWTFNIERELESGRPRSLTESADVELIMVEMPSEIYLKHDGKEFKEDKENDINLQTGVTELQCIVEGGSPEPLVSLFVGNKNMSEDGRTCRGPGRDSKCVQYEIDIMSELNKGNISCVAEMPDVDAEDGGEKSTANDHEKLVSNGKQITVDINLSYKPQLVDPEDPRENTTMTICDPHLCEGEDYALAILFESSPAPSSAEWHIRNNDRRGKTVVKEGNKRRTYNAEYVRNIQDRRHPERFEAKITLENIHEKDMGRDTEHLLEVENDAGTTIFKVLFDKRRACECDPDSNADTENLASQVPGDIKPFLTSCLALGSSLLENYETDGTKRPSRENEREFEENVENFFESATCAGYGREIFSNYKAMSKQEPLSTEIIFHKLDPTKEVLKKKQVNVDENKIINKLTIDMAQKIVSESKKVQEQMVDSDAK